MYECDECRKRFEYCPSELRSGQATFCSGLCRETYMDRELQEEYELQQNLKV